MIYDSKEKAEKAAEEFAMEKLKDGKYVRTYKEGYSFLVYYTKYIESAWYTEEFKFRTLKKGDICWVWDEKINIQISMFTGEYTSEDAPLFSEHKDMETSCSFNHYEPTGLNIFDGVKNED